MHPEDVKAIDAYTEIVRREAAKDAEIARLQEQVETQIAGHRLTAKEATANLIRANKAEAGLEEMTRSCLAERAGRLAAEAERDRLREAMERTRDETVEEILSLLTCHELYRYRPKAFDGFIAHVRAALQKEPQP